ncbi:ATP-binding protein [Kiloniella spongiae]|uniref:ATP-binding protein n=1 Tax=Kiloniella spongiae TaxID=1489064 RepID=UPI000699C6A0|nr:ATP-binding protein [Kiloniella spongiae]
MAFKSVRTKLLVICTLCVLVTGLVPFLFFEARFFRLEEERIAQRARDVATKVSIPLTRSLWDYDESTVILVLETLMRDPDLVRVRIILPDGAGEFYPAEDPNSNDVELSEVAFIRIPLIYSVFDNKEVLGHLEVGYTTDRAYTDVWTRVFVDAFIFLLILSTLGGGAAIAINRAVGRPLKLLSTSIDEMAYQKKPVLVKWRSDDELGQTVEAYNNMLITIDQHDRALTEAKESAEIANRAKTSFLANMSHELRTPLNAIIGFSEILMKEEDYKVDQKRREEYLGYIFEAGSSLMTMVTDIQQISRLESAEAGLQDEELDVSDEILSCVRALDLRASDEGVLVECSIQDDLPYLRTNAQGFKQIVVNLLNNAIHFTPREGRVDVSALYDSYSGLSIRFSDTGTGIKKEDLPFVTDPFWKSDEEAEERSGLGLSIVKAIIERNQGSLSIESEPDKGTSVTINFPVDRLIDRASLLQQTAAGSS